MRLDKSLFNAPSIAARDLNDGEMGITVNGRVIQRYGDDFVLIGKIFQNTELSDNEAKHLRLVPLGKQSEFTVSTEI